MEIVDEVIVRRVIDLVDREEHRLAGRAQLLREIAIDRRDAGAAVDDEHQRVRFVDRAHRLAVDAGADHLGRGLGIETAGIDEPERRAEVVGLAVAAIAGEVRRVVDERGAAADEPVEQRRLADVRPADDRDQRAFTCVAGISSWPPCFVISHLRCSRACGARPRCGSTLPETLTNSDRWTGLPSDFGERDARGDAELLDPATRAADDDRLLRLALDDDHRADRELALALGPCLDLHGRRVRQLLAELVIELLADDLLRDELRRAIGDRLGRETATGRPAAARAITRSSSSTPSPVAAEIGTTSSAGHRRAPRLDDRQELGLLDAIDLVERDHHRVRLARLARARARRARRADRASGRCGRSRRSASARRRHRRPRRARHRACSGAAGRGRPGRRACRHRRSGAGAPSTSSV